MKIVIGFPPNIDLIRARFPLHQGVVFTYGDTLYNPDGAIIPNHLLVHEEVHVRQQGSTPEKWWEIYFIDKEFRLSQEAEAYGAQYQFVHSRSSRQVSRDFLKTLANQLSSPLYGKLCSFAQAKELIQSYGSH